MKSKLIMTLLIPALTLASVAFLAACAPQNNTQGTVNNDDAVSVSWSMDSDCTACHSKEASSMTDTACLASTHATQGLDCTSCHTDEQALTEVHADVTADATAPTKLQATQVGKEVCTTCHDTAELKAATATSTVLTDSRGTVVNPHDLPVNDSHAEISCNNCHEMHTDKAVDKAAPAECRSCHHANVYQCYTCHE